MRKLFHQFTHWAYWLRFVDNWDRSDPSCPLYVQKKLPIPKIDVGRKEILRAARGIKIRVFAFTSTSFSLNNL